VLDHWIIDWTRDARLPYYTRANAGEVLADPASPLGWTLVFEEGLLPGWLRGFEEFGVYAPGELSKVKTPVVGIFGGYFYLNLSHMRLLGLRLGMSVADFDAALLGSHPDAPPYDAHPDDINPACSAKAAETIGGILSATSYPQIDEDRRRTEALRRARPDLRSMSDDALVAHARSFAAELDNGFAVHDFSSLASTIGPAMIGGIAASVGRSDLVLDLISGLGDVDSASPSTGLWALSREANASPDVAALFARGAEAVRVALETATQGPVAHFAASFTAFLADYGYRGPNEWDIHSRSWETDPVAALALVDTIRHQSDTDSPDARHARLEARRSAAADEIRAAIAGDDAALATFETALASTLLSVPVRERTKATCVCVVNEVRVAVRELGRRGVEAGLYAEPEDVMMLMSSELDDYVADPAALAPVIAARLADYEQLFEIEPPFIIASDPPPLSQWKRRRSGQASAVVGGDVLTGLGGSAGSYTGRVCVITDLSRPEALEPGDILVAPFTDAAWTPLFLVAGAVVVDMGAMNSHAVVVCRELGIPCVLSVTDATERLRTGMEVTVDGKAGTVTVVSDAGVPG
jgi:phosphohistidine swiveling domain-containing protein